PPPGALRQVTRPRGLALGVAVVAALAAVPRVARTDAELNFLFLVLLSTTLAQSWNIVAGYAGQVNLGHAAFFGLGALTTRTLWIGGTPVLLAMGAGALVATAFALLIGVVAFRLRGAYFAIRTLALGEILRLAGGLFAYYHISYYPSHPFGPHWTFDALLITFVGGVGTLHGPVLGAIFYVLLKEYLAVRWVDFHLLIFGALFIGIVLLLPGGLVEAAA